MVFGSSLGKKALHIRGGFLEDGLTDVGLKESIVFVLFGEVIIILVGKKSVMGKEVLTRIVESDIIETSSMETKSRRQVGVARVEVGVYFW